MTRDVCSATSSARHLDHDELAEWLKDLATLEPQNWRDILFRKAVKIQQALLETAMPAHLQDAPRTLRNTFDVTDPNDPKKTVKVVFASFAVCMEREANQLRSSVRSATTSQWIDIGDRLPAPYHTVLIGRPDIPVSPITAFWTGEKWCKDVREQTYHPTHWMELPEQPNAIV